MERRDKRTTRQRASSIARRRLWLPFADRISAIVDASVGASLEPLHRENAELRRELVNLASSRPVSPSSEPVSRRSFPSLEAQHVQGAKLYANRQDLLADLQIAKGGRVAEVGVGLGDFSEFMIRTLAPSDFVAFDSFRLHELETLWGRSTTEIFGSGTHRQQYEGRFEHLIGISMHIVEGLSEETLAQYQDGFFDLIYIDAGHTYEEVLADARVAASKLSATGVLIFNDYIMYDHLLGVPYGIVPVVNELVVNDNWIMVGFALQHELFCDVAIRRP